MKKTVAPLGALLPAAFLAGLLALFLPLSAYAEGLSASMELDQSYSTTKEKPLGAEATSTRSTSLVQRYSLNLDRAFYPSLRFNSGVLVELDKSNSAQNGDANSSSSTHINPNATLSFGNSFVSGAVGYSRSEQSSVSSGVSSPTDISENYTGRLGFTPEGLPTVDLRFSRSSSSSSDGFRDNTSDSYALTSQYRPIQKADLSYQGMITDGRDRITSAETQSITQSVTARYSDYFFQRVNFYATGIFSETDSKASSVISSTAAGGGGTIVAPLTRLAGYFALGDNPALIQRNLNDSNTAPPIVLWTSVPTLIDGGDKRVPANPVINLGVQPIIGGEARRRNIGLDLVVPTMVNLVHLYVTQPLPQAVAGQFIWSVYTSSDNENWTLANSIGPVGFETVFDAQSQALVQRFVIAFANVTTRYVKVVTAPLRQQPPPLPSGVDLSNILVTEMEAALTTSAAMPAGQGGRTPSRTSSSLAGSVSSGLRADILNLPGLPVVTSNLNANYNFGKTDATALSYNYFVSTGLTAFQSFNELMSGSARISWENQQNSSQQATTAYVYGISMEAHPLPALSHNVTFSGRLAQEPKKTTTSTSVSLNNSALIYQGVSASLSGGAGSSSVKNGIKTSSTYLTLGIGLLPSQTLNTNISYSGTWSNQSGGGAPETSSSTGTASVQTSYNPLQGLTLFGSIGYSTGSGSDSQVTQNYGGSWSPFRDGALQFSVSYTESLTTVGNERVRVISPGLRWNIRPGGWLSLSYAYQSDKSSVNETVSNSLSSTLRLTF